MPIDVPHRKPRRLADDEPLVVLPKGHPLAELDAVPAQMLRQERFLMLEKGDNDVVTEAFSECGRPEPAIATWDDYAIMAMVEAGIGVSVLPSLVLRRVPYDVELRPLAKPVFRQIGIATRRVGEPVAPAGHLRS